MKPRNLIVSAWMMLFLLAACQSQLPAQEAAFSPVFQPTPTEEMPASIPTTYPPDFLENLAGDSLLLQLELEPANFEPRHRYIFGRVPQFTLFADGRLFFQIEDPGGPQLLTSHLSQSETLALLQEVLDLGAAGLEKAPSQCVPPKDQAGQSSAETAYPIFRAALPDGQFIEVCSQADSSKDSQALQKIVQHLINFTHPQARPYDPEAAALFLQPVQGEAGEEVESYPLSGRFAPPSQVEQGVWAFYLSGEELEVYQAARQGKHGRVVFSINGNIYQAGLVPWLPGMGYRQALERVFPVSSAVEVQGDPWLSTCPTGLEARDTAGSLRLVYLDQNDLYLIEEVDQGNTNPVRLTESGRVTHFQLSPDGAMAYFDQQDPQGARLWAMDLFTGEQFPLSAPFLPGHVLELHEPSPANTWLPFTLFSEETIFSDQHNGDLYAAHTNGEGIQKLVGTEALTDPDLPQCGAVPTNVQWIPNTERLVFDGLPVCEGIFIYVPSLETYDLDTGQVGPYPSGMLTFSKDGSRVAVSAVASLSAADALGSQAVMLNVPYYALGMGEWWFYPPVRWDTDDQSLFSLTTGSNEAGWESFGHTPVSLYRSLPTTGQSWLVSQFEGNPWSFEPSTDSKLLSYYTDQPGSNERILHLARFDGSEDIVYAAGELIEFHGWAPGGRYFTFETRGTQPEIRTWLGDACGPALALLDQPVSAVRWVDDSTFVFAVSHYEEGEEGAQGMTQLYLGRIDRPAQEIVEFRWQGNQVWQLATLP